MRAYCMQGMKCVTGFRLAAAPSLKRLLIVTNDLYQGLVPKCLK